MDAHEKSLNNYVDSIKESLISQQLNIDSLNSELQFRTKQVALAIAQRNRSLKELEVAHERLAEEVEA